MATKGVRSAKPRGKTGRGGPPKTTAKRRLPPAKAPEQPTLDFEGQAAWSAWLAEHHASSNGVWLRMAKKGSGLRTVTYLEAVESALCWGWIDGQARAEGAETYVQRFTPRRKRSVWSKINRDKALALIASGAMRPPGLAEVERAQQDGRWAGAYDSPSKAAVPNELAAALEASPRAAAFFATLNASNRYSVIWRVQTAQRAETRSKRIATLIAMLERGEKFHP
jgi:uncharacterized protein YdeI (YjbR/CyaY-like superfamily)